MRSRKQRRSRKVRQSREFRSRRIPPLRASCCGARRCGTAPRGTAAARTGSRRTRTSCACGLQFSGPGSGSGSGSRTVKWFPVPGSRQLVTHPCRACRIRRRASRLRPRAPRVLQGRGTVSGGTVALIDQSSLFRGFDSTTLPRAIHWRCVGFVERSAYFPEGRLIDPENIQETYRSASSCPRHSTNRDGPRHVRRSTHCNHKK